MINTYCSLHNHCYASNIRFLDSINRPEDMINKAINLGLTGIAFTDHESLSAAVDILKIRDKIKQNHPDFKIIFGNEIYLIDEKNLHSTRDFYHFILLAKDETGWNQLRNLSSRAWDRGYMERGIMRVPTTYQDIEEIVRKDPGHIYASTACLGGQLAKDILAHNVSEANNFVRWCMNTFGSDNFVIELQPSDSEEQILVNKIAIQFAKHYNLPFIVTTDSHYLNEEDFAIHSAFLNSKEANDRETEKFYRFTFLMEIEKIQSILKEGGTSEEDIEAALNNTIKIGEQIEEYDFRHSTIVPRIEIPTFQLSHILQKYYDSYPAIKQFANSDDEQDRYLLYQVEQGLQNKKVNLTEVILDRINTELDVLSYISDRLDQKLSAYLNLTADIINIAWKASLVGAGRGSSCGFYINYLTGITQVDPLVYNLPYWRFLNKERIELPDIDTDIQPEKTNDIIQLLKNNYGEDNVINCATFKTESLKAAILSVGRGLGFNNDDMQALAALVPAHRGMTYSLQDCLEGNDEQGLNPVPGFEDKFYKYPGLLDGVRKIEGLPTNASIHASALYIFNGGYLSHNSLMRAPNGTKITAFNMHDSDDLGALKMDVLRTEAQSKMAKCMDLLLKNKEITWEGSLRGTYDKYLHPDTLEYNDEKMWEKAANGEITNLFQMDTQVGAICIKKAHPSNVMQLAEINSIMRLQVEGSEQPIDRYVKFRNNIEDWYQEMTEKGLSALEQSILRQYLDKSFGISGNQETLMLLVMDPNITGFTLGEANGFRKAIAKKKPKDIQINKEKYFEYGEKLHTSEKFLNYVWQYCVEPQLGYSFSLNHTLPYSIIALQEMNLATKYSPLYWQCACLCVNSGNFSVNLDDDSYNNINEEEDDTIEEKNNKKTAPNYGKIAKAIDDAQHSGVDIEIPDINKAEADFIPDLQHNSILYSLQTVNVVNEDLLNAIIINRPFTSCKDFFTKVQPTIAQMIGLIKAGCFDNLSRDSRVVLMNKFLSYFATLQYPIKPKLTMVHLKKALDMGMDFSKYDLSVRIYKFKKYLTQNKYLADAHWYKLDEESCVKFFHNFLEEKFNSSKNEYGYLSDGNMFIKESSFKRIYNECMSELMSYLNSEEGRQEYANFERNQLIQDLKDRYCKGSVAT